MATTISATDSELPKPVNVLFQQTLLRNARVRAPYFIGTAQGELTRHSGTATASWRRIENLSAATTALSELTTTASYMQGRDSAALSVTPVTATVSKYGNYVILNEEADVFNFNGQMDKIMEVIGINAGQTVNILQRNITEDNLTLVQAGGAASDGATSSILTVDAIKLVMNTLEKNSAITFTPMTTGSQNIGTSPILPAYWALVHPDVAIDATALTGFKSVETYAGQVSTVMGEFGLLQVAGRAVRFISSEDAGVDTGAGAAVTSEDVNSTSASADLYTVSIYGMDCVGSVGFGDRYPDGTFEAGDDLGPVELIVKGFGSGGTSDPYNEIMTVAWKAWHTGTILNATWGRGIRCAATNLAN